MSNDWFERGVQDAQNDQLNTTYYQHYYYYRLGYDQARRQMRKPALGGVPTRRPSLLIAVLLVAAASAALYLQRQPEALPVASTPATLQPTVRPTASPTLTPAPTPEPTPAPLTLRPEGFATIVNTNGAPLNGRAEPSTGGPVTAKFPEGSRVRILEGPVEADGFIWWRIESDAGSGWSAQGQPDGNTWLEPAP